ncbi:MAG TPA: shikimate kinase [Candidatus Fimivicinus intestinavium]|nr:shikimate kinase [Candidatus Fimivicinus intestinavium]
MNAANLILCGFMGCGKSTVGRVLAARTGLAFVDMDHYIVKQAGLPVEEIFARYGERHFRSLEAQACKTLSQKKGQVIATGGGALTFPENTRALKQNGVVILLDVSLPILQARLERDSTPRPVLQKAKQEGTLETLHANRMELYRKAADLTVSICKECSADAVAEEILDIISASNAK